MPADVARAVAFYQAVFDWQVEDWSEFAGGRLYGVVTGEADQMGINGAIMQRQGPNFEPGAAVAGGVLTMGPATSRDRGWGRRRGRHGRRPQARPPPGMAWQGYFLDIEGTGAWRPARPEAR
ncbi:MAG: VOC family protein [Nocardioidaceae bacterium]